MNQQGQKSISASPWVAFCSLFSALPVYSQGTSTGITETATRIAGQPASLVPADFTLIGTWNVSKPPNDGPKVIAKYEFIDDDTVRITDDVSSLDPPIDAFYFIQGPRTAIRGTGYFVAVTESGMVVLVNTQDETNSLVAEQVVER